MASTTLPKKRKQKSTKHQSQTIMCSWWSPVRLLSRTASWRGFLIPPPPHPQETWGVMMLCCFWKYIPACQRKTQPEGSDSWRRWDPISALSLEPFRCDTPPVPSHDWSGLSNWLLPAWTCLWMTTSFLPKCVFSFNETRWQWQIED